MFNLNKNYFWFGKRNVCSEPKTGALTLVTRHCRSNLGLIPTLKTLSSPLAGFIRNINLTLSCFKVFS